MHTRYARVQAHKLLILVYKIVRNIRKRARTHDTYIHTHAHTHTDVQIHAGVYVTESLERACIACFNHEKRERLVLYEL